VGVTPAHRLLLALAALALLLVVVVGTTLAWAAFATVVATWVVWAAADRLIRGVTAHPVQRPPAR
jgi:hypothetical protein